MPLQFVHEAIRSIPRRVQLGVEDATDSSAVEDATDRAPVAVQEHK